MSECTGFFFDVKADGTVYIPVLYPCEEYEPYTPNPRFPLHCLSFCIHKAESWTVDKTTIFFFIFSHSAVIETAMKYIVTEKPSGGLAYQDLFFREVRNVLLCVISSKDQLKCDGTCAETRFRRSD